jgi:hypothetical protein
MSIRRPTPRLEDRRLESGKRKGPGEWEMAGSEWEMIAGWGVESDDGWGGEKGGLKMSWMVVI